MPTRVNINQLKQELKNHEFDDEGIRWRVYDVIYDVSLRMHMVLYADVNCRYVPPRPEDLESSSVGEVKSWMKATEEHDSSMHVPPSSPATVSHTTDSTSQVGDSSHVSVPHVDDDVDDDVEDNVEDNVDDDVDDNVDTPSTSQVGNSAHVREMSERDNKRTKRMERLKRQLADTCNMGTHYYRKYKQCVQSTDGTPTSTPEFRKLLYER